ncbi:auxin-responsive protein IAA26-like [Syzygium oleosum]|uniref:auxin-responsive protein IAA26-like n=1 Tax=Syzygium oleosum TaxID=219896 RepID=UPI0011D2ADCA|nr:auxin-responsive protein IAA26-like [Syzygium oleosum]XP_056167954.1 auxin-responsive protein IAA26-like [Syzygium oleosum]
MERVSRNGEATQLLDFVAKEREWLMKRFQEQSHGTPPPEDKALELKLGPPGDEDQSNKDFTMNYKLEKDESLLSLGYFNGGNQAQAQNFAPYLQFSPSTSQTQLPVLAKDISSDTVDLQNNNDAEKKKAFSPASAAAITAVPNSSQKRTAPAPVVGWPPLRSFRKNLAIGDSHGNPAPKTHHNAVSSKIVSEKPAERSGKGLFVKIYMDGVPIGRKVDLNAYDSYLKLSAAVDELFRGLLAAQRDSSGCGIKNTQEEEKPITGLLDGRGEYTLVYEDYEGDRMLVGDVPWHMFISTVKRLRVFKSSEISVLSAGGQKQDKTLSDSAMR